MLREDFCLITGFRFDKVNLDPDEEDHCEFRMRVFLKIENLKGEHMLELFNKDVKFAKLDDKDAIWGLETFSNSIHWSRKEENVIPRGVAWSNGLKFEKSNYERFFYSKNSTINKLIPSTIEMNELWWRYSLDYFKKVTRSIPVLRSATNGSSIGKSFHTRVRTEVRHEVHVRTEVSRVHSKEEMILDLQRRLNSVDEKLKPGPSDVDHLDKDMTFQNVTRSPTAPKRTVIVPEEDNALVRDKNSMEMRWTFPWCADAHLVYIDFRKKLVGRSHTKRGWLFTSMS
nr:hypothetical protein [Tanacetum cinerariifolium]